MVRRQNSGFTLVELAVVLLIISVVIGGVLTGQGLIQTANLNSAVTKLKELKSGFSRYQIKYGMLPGDDTRAYDRWAANCAASAANCEGDGDVTVEAAETYKAWKHLELSKMITGKFCDPDVSSNCYVSDSTDACEQGVNIPALAMDSLGAAFLYDPDDAKSTNIASPLQTIVLGLTGSSEANCASAGYFTAEQMFIIDKKIDDGLAYNGQVLNSEDTSGCSTSAGVGTDNGTYDQANNGIALCRLFYRVKID